MAEPVLKFPPEQKASPPEAQPTKQSSFSLYRSGLLR